MFHACPYLGGNRAPSSGCIFTPVTEIQLIPYVCLDMAHTGKQVDISALLPGDLLFFARPRKPISHVGIYIGDGLFIHAASKSKKVKLSEINQRYYLTRLVAARRFLTQ